MKHGEIMLAVWKGTQPDEAFHDAWHSDAASVGREAITKIRGKIYLYPRLWFVRVNIGKTYRVDSLLPSLLRSLDEQRSPKAKLAFIEFAIGSFKKQALNAEGSGNSGILKLWLAKLTPLVHDKNTKLKEAAITCIISVYSYFDSATILNYILSLSIEEQNSLRRALKQNTPCIEVDLMNFLQRKKERQRPKSSYDPSDVVGTSSDEGYVGASKRSHLFGRYSSGSIDSDSGRKWSSGHESAHNTSIIGHTASDGAHDHLYHGLESGSNTELNLRSSDVNYRVNILSDHVGSWNTRQENNNNVTVDVSSTPHIDMNGLANSKHQWVSTVLSSENGAPVLGHSQVTSLSSNTALDTGLSITQILHLICNGNDEGSSVSKRDALQQLVETSVSNDHSIWTKKASFAERYNVGFY